MRFKEERTRLVIVRAKSKPLYKKMNRRYIEAPRPISATANAPYGRLIWEEVDSHNHSFSKKCKKEAKKTWWKDRYQHSSLLKGQFFQLTA